MNVPMLKFRKRRKPMVPRRLPSPTRVPRQVFDIGPGPWYYDGKKASSAEYRVLMVLNEMGFSPRFQVNILGGRLLPGGQVLDIVVDEIYPPVIIDVRDYYHFGARAAAEDFYRMLMIKKFDPNAIIAVVWGKETERKDQLESKLRLLVGPYGRRTRA